jgi:hypothetical protein
MFNHAHHRHRREHAQVDGTAVALLTGRGQHAGVLDASRPRISGELSFRLAPRPGDLPGGFWAAHAARCRQRLPAELAWAAPLIDPYAPLPVACTRPQACRLFVWNDQLPTTAQLSFTCEHLAG